MRPKDLKTRIFLDSGNPEDTRAALSLLGFLDGQTTNPSLIAKSPAALKRIAEGVKFRPGEVFGFYKEVVKEISDLIPAGSVSIEVYADEQTDAAHMLDQAKDFFNWIPNAHIKLPITAQGLIAAQAAVRDNMRVNMTLCFSQEQAAAVHNATLGAKKGDVFISPFLGRLDDRGENGADLVENILRMYVEGGSHVEVLAASVRNLDHFLKMLQAGTDIITAPFSVLKLWADSGMVVPQEEVPYPAATLSPIPYRQISLKGDLGSYSIDDPATTAGLRKFADDWNSIIEK